MKKLIFCIALLVTNVTAATEGSPPPDPYLLDNSGLDVQQNTSGLTLRSSVINTAVRNLILITAGQSNRANASGAFYAPANSTVVHNFSIYDGATYNITGNLLGTTNNLAAGPGNLAPRVADLFINNNKFDVVWIVPIAMGSSSISQWGTDGPFNNRICVTLRRLAARGITPGMTNVTFAIDWGQGETDGRDGMTQVTYENYWGQFKTAANACGFVGRYFVSVETRDAGVNYATIQAAQAAVVDNVTVFAGPNLDTLTGANRQADGTHFSTAGAANAATAIYNAMVASGAPF